MEEFFKLKEILDKNPSRVKPQETKLHVNLLEGKCLCGNNLNLFDDDGNLPEIHTGHRKVPLLMCKTCYEKAKEQAFLVCVTCNAAIGFLYPSKDRHGFEIKPGCCYHVRHCPRCKSGTSSSPILEKVLFYRRNKIPYYIDEDLKQEVESKIIKPRKYDDE